ncbi:SigE family RNA polymerase sigma factor [Kribbella speibonae]|uniref:SigE family RNA polymerase sigma factor n=2 Tax=Kribbella speibonae TaxID=1572660 RepID=A0A4R0IHZ9_9ACTN|nr:SigE family RNA polymerase sigma factor [Kribbella speibonae]TCC19591.1 SigE family RNA polymerase sigma factor [Kribbella speibonae]TCC31754.1 SigE family RNA polymerase sigma factor [Kribbella speibonae]
MMNDVGPVLSYVDLVRASERRLLRLGVMLAGNEHTAEDLVQTVLARAHRKWERISGLDRPEAYLRTMVVNEFLSWRRLLKNNEVLLAEPIERPAHDDLGLRQAQRDATWQLLARLPRKQRAVLVLRYYEDLPDAEIAEVLGVAAATVRSNAARALATLREHLTAEEANGHA